MGGGEIGFESKVLIEATIGVCSEELWIFEGDRVSEKEIGCESKSVVKR